MRFYADNDTIIKIVRPVDLDEGELLIDMQLVLFVCKEETETTVIDVRTGTTTEVVVATDTNKLGTSPPELVLTSIEGIYDLNVAHDVLAVTTEGDNTVYELDVNTTNKTYKRGGTAAVPVLGLAGNSFTYDADEETYWIKVSGEAEISPDDGLLIIVQALNYAFRLRKRTIATVRGG